MAGLVGVAQQVTSVEGAAARLTLPSPKEVDAYLRETGLAVVLDNAANEAVKRLKEDPFIYIATQCSIKSQEWRQRKGLSPVDPGLIGSLATAGESDQLRKAQQRISELELSFQKANRIAEAAADGVIDADELNNAEERAKQWELRARKAEHELVAATRLADEFKGLQAAEEEAVRAAERAERELQAAEQEARARAASEMQARQDVSAYHANKTWGAGGGAGGGAGAGAGGGAGGGATPPSGSDRASTRSRRISFFDEATPRAHASKVFDFLAHAAAVAAGGGGVAPNARLAKKELIAFVFLLMEEQQSWHEGCKRPAYERASEREAVRSYAKMVSQVALSSESVSRNEWLDFRFKPRLGSYVWDAQRETALKYLAGQIDDEEKRLRERLLRVDKSKLTVKKLQELVEDSKMDLLFTFLVDGQAGVVQRHRIKACVLCVGEATAVCNLNDKEKAAMKAFLGLLTKMAEAETSFSRKEWWNFRRDGVLGVADEHTAHLLIRTILNDTATDPSTRPPVQNLRDKMSEVMRDAVAGPLYEFLEDERGTVESAAIVRFAASIYSLSTSLNGGGVGDEIEHKGARGLTRRLVQLADGKPRYSTMAEWMAAWRDVPKGTYSSHQQLDMVGVLLHSYFESPRAAAALRNEMTKATMQLPALREAVLKR